MLDALLQHVGAHPDVLRPIDAGLIERLYALIEGVEVIAQSISEIEQEAS